MSKSQVMTAIEASKERFFRLAAEIWNRPEISYQERESAALQKDALREFGFRVAELDEIQANAFIAEFGTGSPVIGLLGEYDALPGLSQKVSAEQEAVISGGPGHGCGHNLLGTACLAAATGIRAALEAGHLKGTVRYYGCPAEEQIGKPALAKAGVFGGLDRAVLAPGRHQYRGGLWYECLSGADFSLQRPIVPRCAGATPGQIGPGRPYVNERGGRIPT